MKFVNETRDGEWCWVGLSCHTHCRLGALFAAQVAFSRGQVFCSLTKVQKFTSRVAIGDHRVLI